MGIEGDFITFILARSFENSVYVVGLLGAAVGVVVFILLACSYLLCCTFCVWPLKRRYKLARLKRRPGCESLMTVEGVRDDLDEVKGLLMGEGMEQQPIPTRWGEAKARAWNVFKVFGWFLIIIVGALPLWSIVMNYLYIWIGVPISAVWLCLCWFFLFPFSPPRDRKVDRLSFSKSYPATFVINDDETAMDPHRGSCRRRTRKALGVALLSGFRRGRKKPILFACGFIGFLILVVFFAVTWEGLCISEYPFECKCRLPQPSRFLFVTFLTIPNLCFFLRKQSEHEILKTISIIYLRRIRTVPCLSFPRRTNRFLDICALPLFE